MPEPRTVVVPDLAKVERFGARTALLDAGGRTVSYAELADLADTAAAALPDVRSLLVLEMRNTVEDVAAYLGALRAGHAIVLTAAGAEERDPRVVQTFCPAAVVRHGHVSLRSAEPCVLHPSLALLLTTSGSTGVPKLVRLSADALDANARSIAQYLRLGPDERAATTLPLHYSYGLSVLHSHLAVGASLLLTERSVAEAEFWDELSAAGCTSFAGVPFTYELLERGPGAHAEVPSLRYVTQAGGRLSPERVLHVADWAEQRGAELFVMYGATEATARMAYLPPHLTRRHPDRIGVPVPGGEFRLVDDEGATVDTADTVGELVYRGPNVMMGYATTAADLARGHDLDELRTGDLASRDDEGLYRIEGRRSRFSKLFGLRVSLDELEAHVTAAHGPAVVAGDDELVAVVLAGAAEPDAVTAALAARTGLPPRVFVVWRDDAPPRLPSGKLDQQALLRAARRRAASGPAPGIAAVFAAAFPSADVHDDTTFVSLDGDSLSYVWVATELEDRLGELPPDWERRTVRELSAGQTASGPEGGPPRRRARRVDTEVALRAAAVSGVVATHAGDLGIGGGAELLLVLAGVSLARFQLPKLLRGDVRPVLVPFLTRIIGPYYACLLAYLVVERDLDVPSLLLASNLTGRFGSLVEPFWFLEALLQCYLLTAALFLLPPVRRAFAARPRASAVALFAAAAAVKVVSLAVVDPGLASRTPDAVLYLVFAGLAAQLLHTRAQRLGVLLGAAALSGADWGWDSHGVWLAAGALALVLVPRLTLPSPAVRALTTVAGASFYIYIAHVVPVYVLNERLDRPDVPTALVSSFALGLLLERAVALLRRRHGAAAPGDLPAA